MLRDVKRETSNISKKALISIEKLPLYYCSNEETLTDKKIGNKDNEKLIQMFGSPEEHSIFSIPRSNNFKSTFKSSQNDSFIKENSFDSEQIMNIQDCQHSNEGTKQKTVKLEKIQILSKNYELLTASPKRNESKNNNNNEIINNIQNMSFGESSSEEESIYIVISISNKH